MELALVAAERGWLPDPIIRWGIRRLVTERHQEETEKLESGATRSWIESLGQAPVAFATDDANDQHYEVPPEFFKQCLGTHLKYSGCDWINGAETLSQAEAESLDLICTRAQLKNGQRILELGCGWGSLSLWMAEKFPKASVVSVSNSAPQRKYIESEAEKRGITNLTVVTCNMVEFEPAGKFDRIVSVEMFEHMRNWPELLGRCHRWLSADGKMFLHVFAHREFSYPFEGEDSSNWMAREFFTGGMMPAHSMLSSLDTPFEIESQWWTPGEHYAKTAEAWLDNIDARRNDALGLFRKHYGREAGKVVQRWRIFFMACAELFGYRDGSEWGVSHHLLSASPVQGN